MTPRRLLFRLRLSAALLLGLAWSLPASAMPVFARQYDMSCNVCHSAYPRLNEFGRSFADELNMRLPNWREKIAQDTGDPMLALPAEVPLAVRAQAYVQTRQAEDIDPATGATGADSSFDFQAPYLIKLLSSAPLSDHITYYFYGIFAEKGANGTALIEDAWFRHDDMFGTGISGQLGQFQISDVMFPREVRMTFQDFQVYRMAGVTYDRGVLFGRGLGPIDISLGAMNGNGIEDNFNIDSPGFRRPDHLFDDDNAKSVFLHLGTDLGPVAVGLFALSGEQRSAAGALGDTTGARDTDRRIYGIDLSGRIGAKTYWFVQALWSRWEDFLDAAPGRDFDWSGGFAGIDYIHSDRWAYSLLYNYNDAGDFDGTRTIYEGIEMNALTFTVSYYFMRNVKGILELTADFLDEDDDADFVGHETKEGYILIGLDAAF